VTGIVRSIARRHEQPVEVGDVLALPSSPIVFLEGFPDVPVLQPRLREFHHIVIPITGAPSERLSLLGRCTDALEQITKGGRPGVVRYQASALAFWLIY